MIAIGKGVSRVDGIGVRILHEGQLAMNVLIPIPAELEERDDREVYALNEASAMADRLGIPDYDVELA